MVRSIIELYVAVFIFWLIKGVEASTDMHMTDQTPRVLNIFVHLRLW